MSILSMIRNRISAGSERFAESDYFEKELRSSRHVQTSFVWTASVIALGLFIIIRSRSLMPPYLLFIFTCGILGVLAVWMDIIRDHRRIHAALQTGSPDEVARLGLKLAAGQAFTLTNVIFFVALILFVFGALLRGGTA